MMRNVSGGRWGTSAVVLCRPGLIRDTAVGLRTLIVVKVIGFQNGKARC